MIPRASCVGCTLLLFACLAGCGDSEGDDADESDNGPTEHGSCNRVSDERSCLEFEGPSLTIDEEETSCTQNLGTWSTELCSTTDLIGCCAYTSRGNSYRDCFYAGYGLTSDELRSECIGDFSGRWTNGAR